MKINFKKILFFITLGGLSLCLQGCDDDYNLYLDDSINKNASQYECSK